MTWAITNRGFLPSIDPVMSLPHSAKHAGLFFVLENLGSSLPDMNDHREVRYELVAQLRAVAEQFTDDLIQNLSEPHAERFFMLFSLFGNVFVNASKENDAKILPKEIAIPLVQVANRLMRSPVLAYHQYCLFNWSGDDPTQPKYLTTLHNFSRANKENEDNYFLTHVGIEAAAGPAIFQINANAGSQSPSLAVNTLGAISRSLGLMTAHADRLCRDHGVYPYTHGVNVVYQGCYNNQAQRFGHCPQLPLAVYAMMPVLGIEREERMSILDRQTLPVTHRDFLAKLDGMRESNLRSVAIIGGDDLKALYNQTLDALVQFCRTYTRSGTYLSQWELEVSRLKV